MQSEDGVAQTFFWKNLNSVMLENGVPKLNFKGFMVDGAQVNWDAVKKICSEVDPSLPMVGRDRICVFHWLQNLNMVTHNYIKTSLQFQHK